MSVKMQDPQVVIIGAGPTGMGLAIELGMRGVPCLVLERNLRAGYSPRAKTTHVRTRELMRRWGIADKLAAKSPFGIEYPTDVHFITRLSGYRLVLFKNTLNCSPERDERYSEHGQWVPQYKLEAVLKEHLETLPGVRLEYGSEFVSFTQDEAGVTVRVRDVASGDERVISAQYLVGADGARSAVREGIGAKMEGRYGLSRNYNIIFEAPGLEDAHAHGPGIMYWQINQEIPSVIGRMDEGDLWYYLPTMLPAGVTLTNEEALDHIKRSTGVDLPYKILTADEWVASSLLATSYRHKRVILAGDACHLHPPFGGFGMNMGVADAVDLGWKLAARLQGWGGEKLLESYAVERRPVHEMVLAESEKNHAVLANQLFRDHIEDATPEGETVRGEVAELIRATKAQEFYALGVVLGYRYMHSPVIAADGTEAGWEMVRDYVPSAAPGCLAPHAWLADGGSLYDLFGPGFTLLAFGALPAAEQQAAEAEAKLRGVPLKIVTLHDPRLPKLYEATRALIRPDQHVAWRGDAWPDSGLLAFAAGL